MTFRIATALTVAMAAVSIPAVATAQNRIVEMKTNADHTEQNRKIISDFADLFYTQRDVAKAFDTYVVEDYIQHNPGAADGRAAAVAMLTPLFSGKGAQFDIKRIVVDGDFAVVHVHGKLVPGQPGVAVFDMYRLKEGKIVEHWDSVQPVPTQAANDHPMF